MQQQQMLIASTATVGSSRQHGNTQRSIYTFAPVVAVAAAALAAVAAVAAAAPVANSLAHWDYP